MQALIIINDPPYGTERLYNGFRLAHALIKRGDDVTVSMADAVLGAKAGQKTPNGYYNAGRMAQLVISKGRVLLCGSCMDARGIPVEELLDGAERSTMEALDVATADADKVLVF